MNKTVGRLPSPPAAAIQALEPFEADPRGAVTVVVFEVFTLVTHLIILGFVIEKTDLCVGGRCGEYVGEGGVQFIPLDIAD